MHDGLHRVHVRERQLDLVHRCERLRVKARGHLRLLLQVNIPSKRLDRVLSLCTLARCGTPRYLGRRHDARHRRDLRETGRLGRLRGVVRDAPLERGLIHEAALAPEGVLEGDKEQEADANEDGEEPERRAPVEALREDTAEDGAEGRAKQGRAA